MQRLFRLSLSAAMLCLLAFTTMLAQPQVFISGRVAPGQVRMFTKDSTYVIDKDYVVAGTLIIEPGTTVYFYPNGRLVDSTGGRIIADGMASADYSAQSANSYTNQYADLGYFLNPSVISINTDREETVNASKTKYVFDVLLDKVNRRIIDIQDPWNSYPSDLNPTYGNSDLVVVSYERALMFKNARLHNNPDDYDPNYKTEPWKRVLGGSPDFNESRIRFIGQPVNNFSREWGHIVVMPGARAAFFRHVSFEGFRKDVTVDDGPYYIGQGGGIDWAKVNEKMVNLTNGAGGALTTFSSRTWLIDADFIGNMARHRGGALQILQSPKGLPTLSNPASIGVYSKNKNPNITDNDGTISEVIMNSDIPRIDMIDEAGTEPFANYGAQSDWYRQGHDDARIAVYLGRFRDLEFINNEVRLADVKEVDGVVKDVESASYPKMYGNHAKGGAVYISGAPDKRDYEIEIGLGVNQTLNIGGSLVRFSVRDAFRADNNEAINYQTAAGSEGSRGGAIYVGDFTSLILGGYFTNNRTTVPAYEMDLNVNTGSYSMGGAIYMENTAGRLQVHGGPERELFSNPTRFTENMSGSGGAIYVAGNVAPYPSPVIGGSDTLVVTRDYGYDIRFENNTAFSFGGAIYTKRNMSSNGSGGWANDAILGYGGKYPVRFTGNSAGFAGGAIMIDVPNANPPLPAIKRSVHFIRTVFEENAVGMNVEGESRNHIRGGGAVYSIDGDVNVVKGTQFINNTTKNGNGGALAVVHPNTSSQRFYLSDLDKVQFVQSGDNAGLPYDFVPYNSIFTHGVNDSADTRMLTRFIGNKTIVDPDILESQSGSGTTQVTEGAEVITDDFFATWWTDPTTGYAVGRFGSIVKLENGGTKWTKQTSNTNYRLEDVEFVGSKVGFAAGDRGTMLKTTNGGNDWVVIPMPTNQNINAIFFTGTDIGYAVMDNGYVAKTVDKGNTWTVLGQPVDNNLYDVFFTSSSIGYAVGDEGIIIKTIDGGVTWEEQVLGGLTTALNAVFFKNGVTGFAAGDQGRLIRTDNGGLSWEFVDNDAQYDLQTIYFSGQDYGYVAGKFGEVLVTTDGAATWNLVDSKTSWSFFGSFFTSTTNGVLVGDYGLVHATTDAGATWTKVEPVGQAVVDVVRYHPTTNLMENGIGLGGAIYILDEITASRIGRQDSVWFNRVRIQNNSAYTGSALYSDNYDLKLIFNRSLIHGNMVDDANMIGYNQNVITGPVLNDQNPASSDLVGATIYGEIQGPLPSYMYSEAANSIYNNNARFLIRLPDAPNTKGVLSGGVGTGSGGTDTLRGNYWGLTEGNIRFELEYEQNQGMPAYNETFFVESNHPVYTTNDKTWIRFLFQGDVTPNPLDDGPIESVNASTTYSYQPIPLTNDPNDITLPGDQSIPEMLLFSGHIYDIYDKGTDIKTADYSKRRMSPIEDFAVGIPPRVSTFTENDELPSYGKSVRRWTRNPEAVEAVNEDGEVLYPELVELQSEFYADEDGKYYHPIGYPLYLETVIDYDGLIQRSNHDETMTNQTTYFVINRNTGDFVRSNLNQVSELAPNREIFRSTVELIPDENNRRPLDRRTIEGLANTASGGAELLRDLYRNPYFEDAAALAGRRYDADVSQLGGAFDGNLFINRSATDDTPPNGPLDMPQSNYTAGDGISNTTFWAGERWRALPVNVGDTVSVVSRTILWREGVDSAFSKGMTFTISASTMPPVFTGNIVQNDTSVIRKIVPSEYPNRDFDTLEITDFQNRIFVTEGRKYPVFPGTYSQPDQPMEEVEYAGRDSILTVTAIDYNRFYDPRAIADPDNYSFLEYAWSYSNNDGGQAALNRWLFVEEVPASDASNPEYLANGYLLFRGWPLNPFVVPGGENVRVSASNFPPNAYTYDKLIEFGASQDLIDNIIETYPSYMHAREYDYDPAQPTENARYFQQDTINIGIRRTATHVFEVFVVDSAPKFLENSYALTYGDVWAGHPNAADTYVEYFATVYKCGLTNDKRIIATVTDKLRLQVDINTDDEWEDKSPAADGWDFRFGRTAYGFINVAKYNDKDDVFGDEIDQIRPQWLRDEYIMEYNSDETQSTLLSDFTTHGQLNVRVPFNEAIQYLIPKPQVNNYLISDTVVAVVVNDGHGGINTRYLPIFINYQPSIATEELPDATEGIDYNETLTQNETIIEVIDPNFEESHTFELVYTDDPRTEEFTDPCFRDVAPVIPIASLKTTPDWVKINPQSGLIYGTPQVGDAPKTGVVISVIVTDENGLKNWKQFTIDVKKANHTPEISGVPETECLAPGETLTTTVTVRDLDLLRTEDGETETITVTVLDAEGNPVDGVTVDPDVFEGPTENGEQEITLTLDGDLLESDTDFFENFGRKRLQIVVTDAEGNTASYDYLIQLSAEVDFAAKVYVENSEGAMEELTFGTAPNLSAELRTSTGDGVDNNPVGQLDYWLCEFDLPPTPNDDVFDARWDIPERNGTLRNMFPTAENNDRYDHQYKARIKAGGQLEGSSKFYPVKIFWRPADIPAMDDTDANPTGASWYIRDPQSNGNVFSSNMRAPEGNTRAADGLVKHGWRDQDQEFYEIELISQEIKGFVIVHDWVSGVAQTGGALATRINSVSPAPVNTNTVINFEVLKSANVKLEVVDILGQSVSVLLDENLNAGSYDFEWNAVDNNGNLLSNGAYQVRLVSGEAVANYPIVIAR